MVSPGGAVRLLDLGVAKANSSVDSLRTMASPRQLRRLVADGARADTLAVAAFLMRSRASATERCPGTRFPVESKRMI